MRLKLKVFSVSDTLTSDGTFRHVAMKPTDGRGDLLDGLIAADRPPLAVGLDMRFGPGEGWSYRVGDDYTMDIVLSPRNLGEAALAAQAYDYAKRSHEAKSREAEELIAKATELVGVDTPPSASEAPCQR